jgi:hypothetical protein
MDPIAHCAGLVVATFYRRLLSRSKRPANPPADVAPFPVEPPEELHSQSCNPMTRSRVANSIRLAIRAVTFLGAAAYMAACSDRVQPLDPALEPQPLGPDESVAALVCRANVAEPSVVCDRPQMDPGGPSLALIVGGQGVYVQLTSSNVTVEADTFAFDVTIQNLIEQAMGTVDGSTPDPNGIRAFFHVLPTATVGSGSVSVANPSGFDTFTSTNQPYFQYDGILAPDSVTAPQTWKLLFDPGVENFVFTLYVSSEVQYLTNWVQLDETPEFLTEGQTHAIGAIVRSHVGVPVADAGIEWTSSDTTVARVDSTGLVTALSPGRVTVSATHGAMTAETAFDVCPDLAVGEVYTSSYPAAATLCLGGVGTLTEYTYIPINYSASSALSLTLTATGIQAVTGPPTPLRAPDPQTELESLNEAAAASLHLTALEADRNISGALITTGLSGLRAPGGLRRTIAPGVPSVGDLWSLNVAQGCSGTPDIRTGRVVKIGANVIIVADTLNPPGTFSTAQYDSIALEMDSIAYPVVTANFGTPTDLDGNGRVVAFYTRAVNELSPPASSVINAGYVTSRDLFSSAPGSCPLSNEGEIMYMMVPDPTGSVNSNVRTVSLVRGQTVLTFGHELQHLINASRRLYALQTDLEEVWLNEGMSHIAEELMFYRTSVGLTPGQNIVVTNLTTGPNASRRVAAFNAYANPNFGRLRSWLQRPDTTGAFKSNDALATRGASWAFLRYAADRSSPGADQQAFWSSLIRTSTGLANLQEVLGGDPTLWLRDFTAAMYADDAVTGIAAQYTNPSWNYRSLFGALNGTYQLVPRTLANGVGLTLSYSRGGGTAFARFGIPENTYARVVADTGGTPPAAGSTHLIVIRTK